MAEDVRTAVDKDQSRTYKRPIELFDETRVIRTKQEEKQGQLLTAWRGLELVGDDSTDLVKAGNTAE